MRRIILTVCIIGIISAGLLYAQGKNGVTQTAQAEFTPVIAVSMAAADSGAATVESKTIKTEIQSPGVVTEYKEDGTKVVTINLSEIDENKLPEKYEAKVILEAPILEMDYIKANKAKLEKKVYFAYLNDDDLKQDIDVKIDENGFIYIFDPYMGRIQKFNSDGKHLINIPFDNTRKTHLQGDHWIADSMIDEFVTGGGNVYLRDTAKNRMHIIDEKGKVIKTTDIPEEVDGQNIRKMKMWADEEGAGVVESRMKKQKNDKENIISDDEKNASSRILKNVISRSDMSYKLKKTVIAIYELGCDMQNNTYFRISAGEKKERGVLKISKKDEIKMFVSDSDFWWDEKWKDGCEQVRPLLKDYLCSVLFSKDGIVYLVQDLCCHSGEDCVSRIRIIALKRQKAN